MQIHSLNKSKFSFLFQRILGTCGDQLDIKKPIYLFSAYRVLLALCKTSASTEDGWHFTQNISPSAKPYTKGSSSPLK
jgi:hypothetical protein